MTTRELSPYDYALLSDSIEKDEYHKGTTTPEFFYDGRAICNVYEDEAGPVLFCRGSKALRIDIQFVNNADFVRNRAVLVEGLPHLEERARAAGFSELVFVSDSPLLVRFCKQKLGFSLTSGELRKII